MRNIQIITENGKTKIYIDGELLEGVHSFSVDYLRGAPVLVSLVTDTAPHNSPPAAKRTTERKARR